MGEGGDENEQQPDTRSKLQQEESRQLNAVTDNLDDDDGGNANDASGSQALQENLKALAQARDDKFAAEQEKLKELMAIKVDKEDVEKLIAMFEVSKEVATRVLRESNNDMSKAMTTFVRSEHLAVN